MAYRLYRRQTRNGTTELQDTSWSDSSSSGRAVYIADVPHDTFTLAEFRRLRDG